MTLGGPIDYSAAFQAPAAGQLLNSFNQGLQTAQNMTQTDITNAQLAQMRQMQADTAAVSKNPTPSAIAQLAIKYPAMSENFKRAYDMMNTEQQQARLNQAIPVYAAIQGGNPEVASDLLGKQADAYQSAGQQAQAMQARALSQFVQDHPVAAKMTMGILLAGTMGPDKFTDTFKTVGDERRAEELQPATVAEKTGQAQTALATGAAAPQKQALEAGNIASQIEERSAKLGLNTTKLNADIEAKKQQLDIERLKANMPPKLMENINTAVGQSATANITADKFEDMANRFQNKQPVPGFRGNIAEHWKAFWGDQGDITALRQEMDRLRVSGVLSVLPKNAEGAPFAPRSTSELQLLSKGIPGPNETPEVVAKYFRAAAFALRIEAATSDLKAQWQSNNRTLGPAQQVMNINGSAVPKGITYQKFQDQYLTRHLSEIERKQLNNYVTGRLYSSPNGAQ